MNRLIALPISLALALAASACATTPETPTAEARAECQKMLDTMGTGATHDHTAQQTGAAGSMQMAHARCHRMLGR